MPVCAMQCLFFCSMVLVILMYSKDNATFHLSVKWRFMDVKCIVISSLWPRNSNCYIDSNISIFIGNAIQTVKSNDPVKIISVRGTAFDAADATGGSAANDKGKKIVNYYRCIYTIRHLPENQLNPAFCIYLCARVNISSPGGICVK